MRRGYSIRGRRQTSRTLRTSRRVHRWDRWGLGFTAVFEPICRVVAAHRTADDPLAHRTILLAGQEAAELREDARRTVATRDQWKLVFSLREPQQICGAGLVAPIPLCPAF